MGQANDDNAGVAAIVAAVKDELGPKEQWTTWPGGWPGDIEAALVDAVFSARATYRTPSGAGVHRQVTDWIARRERRTPTLTALVVEIGAAGGPDAWAAAFGNSQHSPGRSPSSPGGATKAATVLEAAQRLSSCGYDSHDDITPDNLAQVRQQLRKVPGIGYATTNYFLMLLGHGGVKPDVMVHRFIGRAVDGNVSNKQAEGLIRDAATRLEAEPHELEHAIWAYERSRR